MITVSRRKTGGSEIEDENEVNSEDRCRKELKRRSHYGMERGLDN